MDLLDSYIRTLRIFLPRDQRDDIIREITEEIREQVADKEAELGRPLTADEQTAVIGQYGHPMLMAARYRPQQHLIGPLVFPYYWLVLRVVIGLVVLGHARGSGARRRRRLRVELGQLGEHLVRTLVIGGWFTLLAAVIDRSLVAPPAQIPGSSPHASPAHRQCRAPGGARIREVDRMMGRRIHPCRDITRRRQSPLSRGRCVEHVVALSARRAVTGVARPF
jgi:hypothetical protein